MLDFPYEKKQHDSLGDHRQMNTKVIISAGGTIEVYTHTDTAKAFEGFHGRVVITLRDKSGNFLYQTVPHQYGVDGVCTPGRPSLDDSFIETIPEEKLSLIAECEIHHDKSKKAISDDELKEWARIILESIRGILVPH
ncbi:hypothetical protein KTC96_11395 [Clostridium estertheticum]|uniref:hypothetical protein n=1 Tax=Clostridium estertheticum TaxID=238834 RepID=UPI001C7DD246|nr:hypothetical protein [Clostridium estertheticum]MBX4261942.1 hypothetical protein [Clostridium estertheticum]WLC68630.1 hypothetical protein KTC96_11395 [Clostridium estertheticum]